MKSGEAFGSFCGSEVILWWEETFSSGLSPWLWVPLPFPLVLYSRVSWESVSWDPGWGSMPTLHSEEDWTLVRPRMATLPLLPSSCWFRIAAAALGLRMAQPCFHADPSHYHGGNVMFAYLCFAQWFFFLHWPVIVFMAEQCRTLYSHLLSTDYLNFCLCSPGWDFSIPTLVAYFGAGNHSSVGISKSFVPRPYFILTGILTPACQTTVKRIVQKWLLSLPTMQPQKC